MVHISNSNKKRSVAGSEVISIGLLCNKSQQKQQLVQITNVLNSSGVSVSDNLIENENGCWLSVTVNESNSTHLLQYLRSVPNKVHGWFILS